MDFNQVTVLIVNYNTPGLLSDAVHSVRNFYESPIMVVDGSDPAEYEQMKEMISDTDVRIERVGYNITHGGGLKHGMDKIQTEYVLTMDSDAKMVKGGFLEACLLSMDKESYGAGSVINLSWDQGLNYLHPFFALLQMSVVRMYSPPIIHGAPMIKTMREIRSKGQQHILKNMKDIKDFVFHKRSGTRGKGTYPRRK